MSLTDVLNVFIRAFDGAFERLQGPIDSLFTTLLALDVVMFGLMLALDMSALRDALTKLLAISTWGYIVRDFPTHAKSIVNMLITAGLSAAGEPTTDVHLALDPDGILERFFRASSALVEALPMPAFDPVLFISLGLSILLLFLAFLALAVNAFVCVLEYYLFLAVAGILIPFGVLAQTRWIAMSALRFVVSLGVKLMVLSFIMAIGDTVMSELQFGSGALVTPSSGSSFLDSFLGPATPTREPPTLRELVTMCAAACGLAFLGWVGPQKVAQGILSGTANMGGNDALRYSASLGGATLAGAGLLAAGAKAAWKFVPAMGGGGAGAAAPSVAATRVAASVPQLSGGHAPPRLLPAGPEESMVLRSPSGGPPPLLPPAAAALPEPRGSAVAAHVGPRALPSPRGLAAVLALPGPVRPRLPVRVSTVADEESS